MATNDFSDTVSKLGQQVALIENRASELSGRLQTLSTKTESLKIKIIRRVLENRRRSLAREAGITSVARDRNKLGIGLATGAAGLVLGGALTRDRLSALITGISSLDAVLQVFGESKWAVSLDRDLLVVPRNRISPGRTWVTYESLLEAMEKLSERAHAEYHFKDISAIVARLKQEQSKLRYLFLTVTE